MDGLDLLVEVVLLLRALHLLFDFGVDALVDVDLLDLDLEEVLQLLQALVRGDRLEELLLLGCSDQDVRSEGVGEFVGIVELERRHDAFERQVVRHLGVRLEDLDELLHVLGDFGGQGHSALDIAHDHRHVAVLFLRRDDLSAVEAFDHHLHVLVRKLEVLDDRGDHTDRIDLADRWVIDFRVFLRGEEDPLLGCGKRRFERQNRGAPADDKRRHHRRKDDHVPQGDEGKCQGFRFLVGHFGFLGSRLCCLGLLGCWVAWLPSRSAGSARQATYETQQLSNPGTPQPPITIPLSGTS